MVRDLDFRVKRTPVKPLAQPATVRVALPTNKKGGPSATLWTVLVLLLVAATIGIWQFSTISTTPTTSVKTPTPTKEASPLADPVPTKAENSILSPQSSSPLVQIYDSGAGSTEVGALVDKLKALGYKVDNLDKSQFNYDRTYIRYRAGMQAEAEKIQSAMPDRLISLKEVQSAGLFDILILLGNN
ncbi:MAG: LytR C-terminal domain-containing protein [Patescibacteria group bacterium]